MKKILAILLSLFMAVSAAACGSSPEKATNAPDSTVSETTSAVQAPSEAEDSETKQEVTETSVTEAETEDPYADVEKEIVVGISSDPSSFYPWVFSQGGRHILPLLFQTLLSDIRDPETGDIVHYHALMDHYEKTDETTYMVYLYDNIYDTAGNPLTSDDICFCWDLFRQGPGGANISGLIAYEAVDDLTVKCTVSDSLGIGDFDEILSTTYMLTRESWEASPDEFNTDPVGTTGYYLAEYVPGSYCVIKKADSYWNQKANETKNIDDGYVPTSDNTKVDTIRFEFITDSNTMEFALEGGNIDIATTVNSNSVPMYDSDENYEVFQYPDNMFGLVFNSGNISDFANINLRKAVAYSISAQDLLDMLYDGKGFALKAFAMDYQIGYPKAWENRTYFEQDKDKAKEFFDKFIQETGKDPQQLRYTLVTMSSDALTKYAQLVQAALIELTGNHEICDIQTYDSATFTSLRNDPTKFDLMILYTLSNKSYVLYNWHLFMNGYERPQGTDICNTGDTKLWDLVVAAQEDLSDENCTAFQDYLDEQCYLVNYICGPAYWVGSSVVSNWVIGAKNSIAVSAMDYDWSVKY